MEVRCDRHHQQRNRNMVTDDGDWKPNGKPKLGGARPGAGRPAGVPNALTAEWREALIAAAKRSKYGRDPETGEPGEDLIQFLTRLADDHIGLFTSLVAKSIPKFIESQSRMNVDLTYRTVDQVRRDMEQVFTAQQLAQLDAMLPVGDVIEVEADKETKQ
jgi:hypothetical protein